MCVGGEQRDEKRLEEERMCVKSEGKEEEEEEEEGKGQKGKGEEEEAHAWRQ